MKADVYSKSKFKLILSMTKISVFAFVFLTFYMQCDKNATIKRYYHYKKDLVNIIAIVAAMVIVGLLFGLIIHKGVDHKRKVKKNRCLIEIIILLLLMDIPKIIIFTYNNDYKYIFLLIIIAATIQYGSKYGGLISMIACINILIVDCIMGLVENGINIYFQNDLITVGVFLILEWVLGYYVELVNNDSTKKENQLSTLNDEIIMHEVQQEKMEKVLANNQKCYKMILEESSDIIIIHDNGRIMYINKKAKEFFGYDNMEEKNLYELYSIEDRNKIIKKYGNMKNQQLEKMIEEEIVVNSRGEKIPIKNTSVYFLYEKNAVILSIFTDISKEKHIKTLQDEAEIDKKQLIESKENNDKTKKLFNNISHELKTPVNVIYSAIQWVKFNLTNNKKSSEINMSKSLDIMRENCMRMTRMINNYIDINEAESGSIMLNKKNDNIVETIENIVQSSAEYLKGNNFNIIFDTDVEEKVMYYDKESMERIILNLLSNSIKFSNGAQTIYVKIEDFKNRIKISVTDEGKGIPKDKIKSIFKTFGKLDMSLSRESEGVGIGLYLVKELVELHNGTIKIISEENKGCEVVIELPVIVDNNEKYIKRIVCEPNYEKVEREFSDIYNLKKNC